MMMPCQIRHILNVSAREQGLGVDRVHHEGLEADATADRRRRRQGRRNQEAEAHDRDRRSLLHIKNADSSKRRTKNLAFFENTETKTLTVFESLPTSTKHQPAFTT